MLTCKLQAQRMAARRRAPGLSARARRPAAVARAALLDEGKVLVAGATGGTGKAVVDALAARGVSVRALARDTTKAASMGLAGVGKTTEIVRGDVFQFGSLPPALDGCSSLVVCTGARDPTDPLGPFNVDYQGTLNLLAAARQSGSVRHVVLVSSIGADDLLNPLNLFWGVLFWKKRAEEEVQRSGLPYTIVRPGGLKTELRQGESVGSIVMAAPGTYGVPPKKSGSILRSQVAEVCVAALAEPFAQNKVVEVIAERDAPAKTMTELFSGVNWY
ncbi:hypothetical protein HYH03_005576 [Edaphochlamys debaryana]|uniref:NAD(P)-binding domain-containing protein n=1 Tax=Edaphochlamys debaryana TaxID=47281 RepID=A0A836C0Y4_9CHLO|nr:hypothetical protein HYH03_005576 [Edaphochlamys debaryana]|eukprot:KAG2496346.1 hypothetical protein HYH03_005576 [Edaphochlamys debaryana]